MVHIPMLPTILIDIGGSAANIIFAFLAWYYAFKLTRRQPDNFIWGYLLYITLAIAAFSISRAAGHIVKELLYIAGFNQAWIFIAPYSGGFNTLFMISVSSVMIFYHKGVQAYEAIEQEAVKLKNANLRLGHAARQMKELNQTLEVKVEERTAELSKSEKKFRHLFAASKDMVFFTDRHHTILDMNQSGSEMLGYTRQETAQLSLSDIFQQQGEVETYRRTLEAKGYISDLEAEFVRKDGSTIYVLISAAAIYDDEGRLVGSEGIAKDLTRLKTMMEQLVASEKMASVGQMAAGVAHEINTPLGVILGYAQLMMDDFEEDSEGYQSLQVIERQTKASRKIVADLLKFSRQSGSSMERINLNEILSDVLAVTEHNLNLSHILVHADLYPDLPDTIGDAEKLRQVFVNLINNSHHAMEEQGSGALYLSTRVTEDGQTIVASIRDSGHGIPEKAKARIFDPFFTTKPVGKGTGLGLSVSYGIILEHGGTIEWESPVHLARNRIVAGTRFDILLPVAQQPADQGLAARADKQSNTK